MEPLTEREILDFLYAIERSEITLTPAQDPEGVYIGKIGYTASNGWEIVIFDDGDDWDYIDRIVTDDGRAITYDEMADTMPAVDRYHPGDAVARERYFFP